MRLMSAFLALAGVLACSGAGGLNDASSDANDLAPSLDPTTLATPAGEVQVVSMADRNMCLRPQRNARPEEPVGTGPCTGDAADSWRVTREGTLSYRGSLCLTQSDGTAEAALVLQPCSPATPSQHVSLQAGRLLLGPSGAQQAVSFGSGTSGSDFVPAQLQAATTALVDLPQNWQVGLAQPGASGTSKVTVRGFTITLTTAPLMCLTGRGTTVGVTACNGSASQQWIVNEAGGLQLGAYCLSATTPGTISQGTPGQFALCRFGEAGQAWVIDGGRIGLQNWFLSPTTVPPPAAGYTMSALSTAQVVWQMGG